MSKPVVTEAVTAHRRSRIAATLLACALAALLIAVAACDDDAVQVDDGEPIARSPTAPIVIPAGEPIVLGVSAPLTGPDSRLGQEDLDAVTIAVERWKAENGAQIAGHDIAVVAEDDGCTETEITLHAAGNLLQRASVVGVIGPNCSDGADAAIPLYGEAGVVAISGSATVTSLTEEQPGDGFFFRTAYRNDLQGALIGLFVSFDLGARSVYVVDDGEVYGEDLADSSQRYMDESGVEVTRVSIERGTVDFSELAGAIAEEAPDVVAFAGFNPEAALFYSQLRDAGYQGLFGAGDAAASTEAFIEPVGAELAEGALFSGCTIAMPDDFLREFVDLHGYEPQDSAFVPQQADAATILLDAVAQVAQEQADGSLVIEPVELRDAVRAAELEDGLSGATVFNENGDRVPLSTRSLPQFVDAALETQDLTGFVDLGLVPCQVQDGRLVNLLGPAAVEIRLP